MKWWYQATKDVVEGEVVYAVREVYEGLGWTERPVYPQGDTKEELLTCLKWMREDVAKRPVLDITEEAENGS